jgi:hypothetical protein
MRGNSSVALLTKKVGAHENALIPKDEGIFLFLYRMRGVDQPA